MNLRRQKAPQTEETTGAPTTAPLADQVINSADKKTEKVPEYRTREYALRVQLDAIRRGKLK